MSMYYHYWGLKKPPFDNVPDTSMYVDCHVSMENAIAETLFAIEEGGECVGVIVGDVGLGKTMSLRMIIDSLAQEKYKIALITNPSITFVQLLKEIIGQLTGKQCEETRKVDLLETFNTILFQTIDEGKRVLIFVDEANAISPANLESLRLLTNMQDDRKNLFTMVLAGQIELARRLEHPKRANLFQRIGTYCKIYKIQSEELIKEYVESRLKLAGATRRIFTDNVFPSLWEYSEQGVPRLINKICKLSLKAGETNGFDLINGEVVEQIGQRFRKIAGPAIQKRKPRKRSVETETLDTVPDGKQNVAVAVPERREEKRVASVIRREEEIETVRAHEIQAVAMDEVPVTVQELEDLQSLQPPNESASELRTSREETEDQEAKGLFEVNVGGIRIELDIPSHIADRARALSREHRIKLAGALAAHAIKQNPQLVSSQIVDPVNVWGEIRECFLNLFGTEKRMHVM